MKIVYGVEEIVDHILRTISRVSAGSYHTFIVIPEWYSISSFLLEHYEINLLTQGFENTRSASLDFSQRFCCFSPGYFILIIQCQPKCLDYLL